MANLTVVVDDDTLRLARIKAVALGTTVNAVCRDAITRFAKPDPATAERLERLTVLAGRIRPDSEPLWPGRAALHAGTRTGAPD
jgi:hypothetical protein